MHTPFAMVGFALTIWVGPSAAYRLKGTSPATRQEPGGHAFRPSVRADKAYSSQANPGWLRRRKIKAAIRQPGQERNRKKRGRVGGILPAFDTQACKERSVVENTPFACSSRSSAGLHPKIRDPAAVDLWTRLIITCHAQLRLARP